MFFEVKCDERTNLRTHTRIVSFISTDYGGHFVQFCNCNAMHLVERGQPVLALDQLLARALVRQLELAAHHLKLDTQQHQQYADIQNQEES